MSFHCEKWTCEVWCSHCAQRRYSLGSLGCCFGRGCLLQFPIVGGGGAGRATDAAGESEIRRFLDGLRYGVLAARD